MFRPIPSTKMIKMNTNDHSSRFIPTTNSVTPPAAKMNISHLCILTLVTFLEDNNIIYKYQ